MTTWIEFNQAYADAKSTINKADNYVADMAEMVAGRLQKSNLSFRTLRKLKKELQRFNMHTGTWSEQ